MKRIETRDIVYIAFYCALAVAFDYITQFIPLLQMPNGGSINLAVIPVFVSSYHLGVGKGMATGLLWWLIGLTLGLNNYMVSPMQTLFDYIIPAVIVGAASIAPKVYKISNVYTGVIIMMMLKYASHVIAGAVYWFPEGEASGTAGAWMYSLGYNLWYNLVTLIIAAILTSIIVRRLSAVSKTKFIGVKQ